jgi:hypothetical protein
MHNAALRSGTNPFAIGTPAREDAFTNRRDGISQIVAQTREQLAHLAWEQVPPADAAQVSVVEGALERPADGSSTIAEPLRGEPLDRGVGERLGRGGEA